MTSIDRPAALPTAVPAAVTSQAIDVPGPAAAEAPAKPPSASELRAIEKQEAKFSEFVVLLDDQATREVEQGFTMPVGPERRQFVAKTLIDNMVATQQPLWKVLDGLQASGHVSSVKGYQPLWIQNSIVVHGDEDARTIMASAAGVVQAERSARIVVGKEQPGEVLAGLEDAATGASEALSELPVDVDVSADSRQASARAGGGTTKPDLATDPQWNLSRLEVDKAAKDGLTGKGVTVGVIDTGLDVEHPFLLGKYRGYNPETGLRDDTGNWYDATADASPSPVDEGAHGTHVSGTIAGSYAGVQTGVAPDAKLVAARGLGPDGGTDGMLLSSFQNMVAPRLPTPGRSPGSQRVVTLGPDVINNSWGSDDGGSISYLNALRNMAAMGIVNVFAAGNDGGAGRGTIGSPASSPYTITVGATDREDQPADFSSQGPNPLPNGSTDPVPFVAAPGTDIRSTIPGGTIETGWQGTSMATPAVTGVIALAQQAALEETGRMFDVNAMKEVLKRAAQDVAAKGPDDATGYGIPVAGDLRKIVTAVAKDLKLDSAGATKA